MDLRGGAGEPARHLDAREPEAIRSLLGRTYTITRPGHVKERRDLSDVEWKDALQQE